MPEDNPKLEEKKNISDREIIYKLCKICGESKPKDRENFTVSLKGYYNSYCKQCATLKTSEYYKKTYIPKPRKLYKFNDGAVSMFKDGKSISEIAEFCHVTCDTIRKWKRKGLLTVS